MEGRSEETEHLLAGRRARQAPEIDGLTYRERRGGLPRRDRGAGQGRQSVKETALRQRSSPRDAPDRVDHYHIWPGPQINSQTRPRTRRIRKNQLTQDGPPDPKRPPTMRRRSSRGVFAIGQGSLPDVATRSGRSTRVPHRALEADPDHGLATGRHPGPSRQPSILVEASSPGASVVAAPVSLAAVAAPAWRCGPAAGPARAAGTARLAGEGDQPLETAVGAALPGPERLDPRRHGPRAEPRAGRSGHRSARRPRSVVDSAPMRQRLALQAALATGAALLAAAFLFALARAS